MLEVRTMKHAYLIMAHNQWELLSELLKAIDDPRNDIYLHIDKKASPPLNRISACVQKSKLIYTKQHSIVWGGTQMMKCTLSMLEHAFNEEYKYYHFISGTDFPIKSQDYLHNFLCTGQDQELIGFDWPGIESGRFVERVQYYHFLINIIGKREGYALWDRFLTKVEDFSLAVQRKLHVNRLNYTMYKGSSWFTITHHLVSEILKNKRAILQRHKFTANADECWLQSFVMESTFKNQLADSNLRYIKWIQGNPSPETLTIGDFENLIDSNKLFARKFDWNKDKEIILRLKEHISKG